MYGTFMRENREALPMSTRSSAGRLEKVMNHNSNMNVDRESDGRVIPTKCPNKGGNTSSAEGMEGRRPIEENTGQTTASQMQSWGSALDGLDRVREAAKKDKRLRFTALLHHVSVALLSNSFYALKREAAPGVDGLTWQEYETDLDKRLEDLHSRVHRGTYRALPSKRAYIPKQDGRERPLGIAALEDKIVQHAVGTVLSRIYEEDFLGVSYGFRPGRGTHDALDALWVGIMRKKVNWVLDADIRDCFGSFSHEWMVKFLQHRIGDRRVLRLIKKWLRAGVLEDGVWSETGKGTKQGSVITPRTQKVTCLLGGSRRGRVRRLRIVGTRTDLWDGERVADGKTVCIDKNFFDQQSQDLLAFVNVYSFCPCTELPSKPIQALCKLHISNLVHCCRLE
jgi:RNA-directed DNA polymerase